MNATRVGKDDSYAADTLSVIVILSAPLWSTG